MSVLQECLSISLINDYVPIFHASLASCHMSVFLHKCTEIEIMQQTSNGPVSIKWKEVAEETLSIFGPPRGWRCFLCV